MNASVRRPGRVLAFAALAAALNLIPVTLPGEAFLLLGPFVYLPVVLLLPLPWGILMAAIAMASSVHTLGHPFAFLLATLEAAWLGLARRRWPRASVLQDAIFWLAVGIPAIVFLYSAVAKQPAEIVALVAVKQALNQFAAVALAVMLLRHSNFAGWMAERSVPARRMRDRVFHSVFLLALAPLTFVGIGLSLLLRAYCERDDRAVLVETSQRLAQQLDLFLSSHQAAVAGVAEMLSRGGGNPAVMLEELRRAQPAFITMLIADAAGDITHAVTKDGLVRGRTNVADRDYFRRARELDRPYVSGVFRGRGFGRDILVAVSAPLRDPDGRFAGVIEGSLEVHDFAKLIVGQREIPGIELILADRDGRVIYADAAAGVAPLSALRFHRQGELLPNSIARSGKLRFDRTNADGRTARFVAYASQSRESGVTVIAQRPLLAALQGGQWVFVLFGGVMAGTLGIATWVARGARAQAAAPLEHFAASANRQASQGIVEPIEVRTEGVPCEVAQVFSAFNGLARQLAGTHAMLRQSNAELDRRVTERTAEAEAARREAERASQSKTDFLAMTSHEIRTPLNAIIGLADSLVGAVPDPLARTRLTTIRSSGERLLGVVNDLLDLSRVEAGRLELRLAPVELGALCGEVRELFVLRAREAGLDLAVEIGPELPCWIETDRARLQQVLINLVGNALKFTPGPGRVRLRVDQLPAESGPLGLRFAVIDTGPGIAREQQARLFQPYVQLERGTASPVAGSGLGLSICRRLVDLFGGRLGVRSESGAGAEFFFTLQIRRAAPPRAEPTESGPLHADAKPRVLAVDDNIANQEVLRSILEGHCETLCIVDNPADALAGLEREPFDVALVDLEMPEMDGFEVARRVRAWNGSEASRDCRLLAVSAHERAQMWTRCAGCGFDDFVGKPINRQALLRAIRAARRTAVAA